MQICATEYIGSRQFLYLDSNASYSASQSKCFTPTVTACRPDTNMTPLKREYAGLLSIDVVNKKYLSIIDINPE